MKITELNHQIEKLPEKTKNAILSIIELKVDGDMENFTDKLEAFKTSVSFKFNVIIWMIGIILVFLGFIVFK